VTSLIDTHTETQTNTDTLTLSLSLTRTRTRTPKHTNSEEHITSVPSRAQVPAPQTLAPNTLLRSSMLTQRAFIMLNLGIRLRLLLRRAMWVLRRVFSSTVNLNLLGIALLLLLLLRRRLLRAQLAQNCALCPVLRCCIHGLEPLAGSLRRCLGRELGCLHRSMHAIHCFVAFPRLYLLLLLLLLLLLIPFAPPRTSMRKHLRLLLIRRAWPRCAAAAGDAAGKGGQAR